MNKIICQQVDKLLLEQGEFIPLEWLLDERRLAYQDYEDWRKGARETLDDALFGDPEQIRQQLEQAQTYLQKRGLQATTLKYTAWGEGASAARGLRFSGNAALNAQFHECYRNPRDQPQMDMFTDAPATTLINGIIHALAERDVSEAGRQLQRLLEIEPGHPRLGELERLVEAAEKLDSPVEGVEEESRYLRETLGPLAESLMGKNSRNLLVPLWRRLSMAARNYAWQSTRPELHLSYSAIQAMDWQEARESVEREDAWRSQLILLQRHARACDHLHDKVAALGSWFELCWRFPDQCDVLETSADHELRQQWMEFQDLDPELPVQNFPAWLLLSRPGLCGLLPEPDRQLMEGEASGPFSYGLMYRLQASRRNDSVAGDDGEDDQLALRVELKRNAPELLHYFLEQVG